MNSLVTFLLALAFSSTLIWFLRASDKKLARTTRTKRLELNATIRAMLALGVFLPGIALLATSQVGVFFSWMGALSVLGWLVARRERNSGIARNLDQ